jgi:hypothetical protein
MDRNKFVYKIFSSEGMLYGTTTDIYMLPIGTKFTVVNGMWNGEIVEKNNKKHMCIEGDKLVELQDEYDYCLAIRINE